MRFEYDSMELKGLLRKFIREPNNTYILQFIGLKFVELNIPESSLKFLARGIQINPASEFLYYLRGVVST